jgi:flagellar FliL protein
MSNKLLIVIVVVFVLLLGMMGTGFFFMWNRLNAVNAQPAGSLAAAEAQKTEIAKIGPIFPLDTFIVNLADEGGNRYLRVTMNLELKDDQTTGQVQDRLPVIRNGILMILPTKTYKDIHTSEGKTQLMDELLAKLNGMLLPGSVTNIYFTEFVVQ